MKSDRVGGMVWVLLPPRDLLPGIGLLGVIPLGVIPLGVIPIGAFL